MSGGHRVQTRWRDVDGLGHVNTAVLISYFEEGRDAFLRRHGVARDQYVVGRCSVEFLREIGPGNESVTVECAVSHVGRSSLTTVQRILDEGGEAAAEAEFGIVLWDAARRASRPLAADERASLEAALEGGSKR